MFSKSLIVPLSLLFALNVKASGVVPTGPAPGANFTAGQDCLIQWDQDTTGLWTKTLIQLMAGSNFDMQVLETVATVDGTTTSSYTWTCPEVDPYSEIYFYQFSIPGNTSSYTWTGRWTIASPEGDTVAPPNSTTYGGQTIYWGNAVLLSGSTSSNSSTTGSVSVTTSAASIVANATSTSATTSAAPTSAAGSITNPDGASDSGTKTSTVFVSESFTASSSSGSASATGSTGSTNTSGAEKLTAGGVMVVALGLWSLI